MKRILSTGLLLITGVTLLAQSSYTRLRVNVPLDSIRLSDPFILADKPTSTYYMTGTGGLLWKSRDLKWWTGPYRVVRLKSFMDGYPSNDLGRRIALLSWQVLLLCHVHQQFD